MARSSSKPTTREDYIEAIRASVAEMAAANLPIGDLKIAKGALEEMAGAFKVFAAYRHVRKVSTFGSARTHPGDPIFTLAERFSRAIADQGFMVITGAGPGIMEACQRGAGRHRSFGVNIRLPHEQAPNPVIVGDPKLMTFRYFFTRKVFFLKEADAVVLFPGGFGTHDEGYETLTLLQTGKTRPIPLILLDEPGGTFWKTWQQYVVEHVLRRKMIAPEDLRLFHVTSSVEHAVEEILHYYRVFHSARYVGDKLVLRLNAELSDSFLSELSREFADIIQNAGVHRSAALPEEADEPDLTHLPRLLFRFDRRSFGRLRMLIDRINEGRAD